MATPPLPAEGPAADQANQASCALESSAFSCRSVQYEKPREQQDAQGVKNRCASQHPDKTSREEQAAQRTREETLADLLGPDRADQQGRDPLEIAHEAQDDGAAGTQ